MGLCMIVNVRDGVEVRVGGKERPCWGDATVLSTLA